MSVHVHLYEGAFNAWQTLATFEKEQIQHHKYGACATFVGRMRDFNQNNSVQSMHLEHYPGMTEQELIRLAEDEIRRFQSDKTPNEIKLALVEPSEGSTSQASDLSIEPTVLICHRVGDIIPSDDIVIVGVWSAHRHQAFSLSQAIMEGLKSKAPFWKKEKSVGGDTYWVSPT